MIAFREFLSANYVVVECAVDKRRPVISTPWTQAPLAHRQLNELLSLKISLQSTAVYCKVSPRANVVHGYGSRRAGYCIQLAFDRSSTTFLMLLRTLCSLLAMLLPNCSMLRLYFKVTWSWVGERVGSCKESLNPTNLNVAGERKCIGITIGRQLKYTV